MKGTANLKLYFLRHGQAGDSSTWPGDDFNRPLTDEGRIELEAAALGLRILNVRPAAILSSPLVRARQTAEVASHTLSTPVTEAQALAPGCDLDGLAEALRAASDAGEVMVVGHEPDFSTLIGQLIAQPNSIAMVEMKKGACCYVDMSDKALTRDALAGSGTLKWLLDAKQLSKIGANGKD